MVTPKINTVMGFDFGMRKIGIAVGQTCSNTAQPLTIIFCKDGIPNWEEIANLIEEWQPDALIVGLPLNRDNSEQPITFAAKKFARRLQARYHLPLFYADERYTSQAANSIRKKPVAVDDIAAAIITETWLHNYHEN